MGEAAGRQGRRAGRGAGGGSGLRSSPRWEQLQEGATTPRGRGACKAEKSGDRGASATDFRLENADATVIVVADVGR